MLPVAQGIIEPAETKELLILTFNFSTAPRRLPKQVVLTTSLAPPPFIVGIDIGGSNRRLCQTKLTAQKLLAITIQKRIETDG